MVVFVMSEGVNSSGVSGLKYEAGAQLRSVVQAMVATRIEQTREKLSSLPSRQVLRDQVREITASRFEQTREKLLLLPSPKKFQDHVLEQTREKLSLMAASPRMLQDHVLEQAREKLSLLPAPRDLQDQVIDMTMDNVRAVSLSALGLLERIDSLLAPDVQAIKPGIEEDNDDRYKVTKMPRVLAVQVMRTFSVQLSRSATLRVTVLCMADTCTSVLRQLRVADKQQLLKRLHLVDVQQLASCVGSYSSALLARAKRMHPYLDWALGKLGDRLAVRIFGNDAAEVGAQVGMEVSTEVIADPTQVEAGLQMPEVKDYSSLADLHVCEDEIKIFNEAMMGVVTEFQLIVKNSFLEFVDDAPDLGVFDYRLERSRSMPDLSSLMENQAFSKGTVEPYTVKLSCVDNLSTSHGAAASSAQHHQRSDHLDQQHPLEQQQQQRSEMYRTKQQQQRGQQQQQQQQIAWVVASHHSHRCAPGLQQTQRLPAPWHAPLPMLAYSPIKTPRDAPAFLSPASAAGVRVLPATSKPKPTTVEANLSDVALMTTVLLRSLPIDYTRSMLLELIDSLGFSAKYDFVYVPVDFTRGIPLGYALVSCCDHAGAQEMLQALDGFSGWAIANENVCSASWSEPHQGLEAHVERYRNSPVMHHSVPDHYKPLVFELGKRLFFPAPTQAIRAPRIRHLKPGVQ